MGAFLLSEIRDALNAYRDTVDCCIIKGASCPRAAKAYDDDAFVSLETLRAEIQAKDDVNVYKLSGHALKHGVRERWSHANPGFMQIDDGISVDGEGYVTHVRGEPLDEARIYRVASFKSLERESDGGIIAGDLKAHPERMPGEDDGVQCHALLVGHWARRLWERIYALADADGDGRLSAEEFATLDEDGSGRINRRELKHAIARAGYETFSGEYTLVDAVLEGALAASFYSLRVVRVGIARHVHVASMAPRATPSTRCPTQLREISTGMENCRAGKSTRTRLRRLRGTVTQGVTGRGTWPRRSGLA
jgi:hypothetical protein